MSAAALSRVHPLPTWHILYGQFLNITDHRALQLGP
jgi:hypothetical protein